VETDGAVIQNLYVLGTITVRANNVTLRNMVVDPGGAPYGIRADNSAFSGTVIEDAEVLNADAAGVYGDNFTARRLNVHHGGADGIKAGSNCIIEDSWIHELGNIPGTHADGIQVDGGTGIVIRRNFIDMPVRVDGTESNAAVFIKPDFAPIDSVLIEDNWMNGGNFTVFLATKDGVGPTNVTVRRNYFGRDFLYGVRCLTAGSVWQQNYWWDTGALIP
jgi:hypothetical protein